MISRAAIEAAAEALFDAMPLTTGDFGDLSPTSQNDIRHCARVAIEAALAAEGMALVPVNDLLHVIDVADRNEYHPSISRLKTMLKAAGASDAGK